MEIIRTENISKTYSVGSREMTVLRDVSLSVAAGEFVVISGNSGSGKTTLLSLISGLDRVSSGRIYVDGKDITDLGEDDMAYLRNSLTGFVFQSFHLVPSLNGLENVMFPAELRNDHGSSSKAEKLLRRVGLWSRRSHFPEQLSGGEKQRIALCRALINNPKVIYADEPTGNLDSRNSDEIIALLREMQQEYRTTLIMATHSSKIAEQADRIVNIHDGVIIH